MDLSKAFDCLSYGLITAKLRAYGLSRNACDLLPAIYQTGINALKYKAAEVNGECPKRSIPRLNIGSVALQCVYK